MKRRINIWWDNVLLWIWWHTKEKRRWKQFDKELKAIKQDIDKLENQIKSKPWFRSI